MIPSSRVGVEGTVMSYNENYSKVRRIGSAKGVVILNKQVRKDLSFKVIFK